jgi:hypothetical protein
MMNLIEEEKMNISVTNGNRASGNKEVTGNGIASKTQKIVKISTI